MRTILIMDEDQAIRRLYREELSDEGYEVITCGDAQELIELISRTKPDLLVMEALLKNGDGLELLQDISHTFSELPVILCTASPAFKQDPRSLAAHRFLVKHSNLKVLKTAIKDLLAGRTPPRRTPRPADGDLPRRPLRSKDTL